ncbi:MAG: hypothetical protein MJ137_07440 [Clostridia bacterium]|nr:hypothetical protein [Clostridia bacterium]
MNIENVKLPPVPELPRDINGGEWDTGHVQGIALDTAHKYVYYSFTTVLVKTDISGNLIGTVSGLTGHLGCISFNDEDGKVYGSIEYKHDAIGQGIMKRTGRILAEEDAFYCAIFDVDKIDRVGLDAEKDGIMKAVYLPDVVGDFSGEGADGKPHRYACSGIDGTGFGPDFGAPKDSPRMLFIAYGIYGDNERRDNDHQVILRFDWRRFDAFAEPLNQDKPHHSGIRADHKYFLYTGNTTWGVQNLEYDAFLDAWLLSVYVGKKPQFRNPPMFIVDRTKAPVMGELKGLGGEQGELIFLKEIGVKDEENNLWGGYFPKGDTGIYAFGNGYYYFSFHGSYKQPTEDGGQKRIHTCHVKLVKYTGELPELFSVIED